MVIDKKFQGKKFNSFSNIMEYRTFSYGLLWKNGTELDP